MGLLDTIQVGRRGLAAASAGIDVTAQNIANVGTTGYSRRKLVQTTTDPIQRRGLWMGTGVQAASVSRATDRLLGVRLVASAGVAAQASSLHETLAIAEGQLGDTGSTTLSDANDAFWDSMSQLTTNPSDLTARRTTIQAAGDLASTISRIATGLSATMTSVEDGLTTRLELANAKIAEIGSLNKAIGRSSDETGPADLLDRRDQLVRELGETVGATVDLQADGQATVFIGGHAVVNGAAARPLTLGTAADGSPEISVGSMHVTNDVGGELGGVLTAHATISGWIDELDQFTTTFATAVNAAHAAGFDATGAAGGDLFSFDPTSPGASITVSTALEDPSLLAVAGAATAAPGDGDNLASMLTLESSAIFSGATRTAGQALSDFSSGVGSDVSAAGGDADVLDAQLSDAETQRNALASVDTDEEAIRLVEYQTAYKAAARVLSVGDEMLRTLLQTVGG